MLIEVNNDTYRNYFPNNPNPFISQAFIELNIGKVEKVIRLVEDTDKPGIGLVAGVRNGMLLSPFSAPFGGFHFRKDVMYINEIDDFINSLKDYLSSNDLKGLDITLPPDIYHLTFNSKCISSLIRNGFTSGLPEITNWIDLNHFSGEFRQRNSREYYRQALRNELSFEPVTDIKEKSEVYELIRQNRAKFGRPIYMSFDDIEATAKLWPTDYFKVVSKSQKMMASAIFYRSHPDISFALFWGDNEEGRPLRAMDFLASKLWIYYKNLDFKYIDLGISTEAGIPNEGLLRFKESHDATSSIKYKFSWSTCGTEHAK